MAADDNPGEESINVVDWAEAIVDRVKRLRERRSGLADRKILSARDVSGPERDDIIRP